MAFQAKIRMNKSGPQTHTSKFRALKQGQSFVTTNAAEVRYYQSVRGFTVTITSGKMTAPPVVDEDVVEDEEVEDDEEGESEERDEDAVDAYDRADLKKMKAAELRDLIEDDEELPLSKEDVKGMRAPAIIDAILEAQSPDEDDDEDEDEEDD